MVAAFVEYDFAAGLAPSSASPGFAGSAFVEVGSGSIEWRSAGQLRYTPGSTSTGQTTSYIEFTVTPDDPAQPWSPETLAITARRIHTATTQGYRTYWSVDGYAALIDSFFGLTTSHTTRTIALPDVEITGPVTFRLYGTAGSTSAYLDFETIRLDGSYTPAGAADVTVLPGAVASAEAFGSPTVSAPPPQAVEPPSFGGDESFGTPSVEIVPPAELHPGAIGPDEAFGVPVLRPGAPYAVEPYPTGEDVVTFLGAQGGGQLAAVAGVHVDTVTHFARTYCRGNGFFVEGLAPEIAAVITAAATRLFSNPEQLDITVGNVRRASSFKGWTLAEQRVLNQYRGVAR